MNTANFIIVGRLTHDAEIRTGNNGKDYAIIKIATETSYRNAQGEQVKTPHYHTLLCFKENLLNYLSGFKKGNLAHIVGDLKPHEIVDQNGNKISVERLEVTDAKNFGGGNSGNYQNNGNNGQNYQNNGNNGQNYQNNGNGNGYRNNGNGQNYQNNGNGNGYRNNGNGQNRQNNGNNQPMPQHDDNMDFDNMPPQGQGFYPDHV